MRSIRTFSHAASILLLAATVSISACSDSKEVTGPGQDTIEGTWQATSFVALGTDAIADGMTFKATFNGNGGYTFVVTNDKIGVCGDGGGPNCTNTGDYTSTASQITIDAGSEDETTFNFAIVANKLTFTGSIGDDPVTVTWTRVS